MSRNDDQIQQLLKGLEQLFKQVEQNREDIDSMRGMKSESSGIVKSTISSFTSSFRSDPEKELKRQVEDLERQKRQWERDKSRLEDKVSRLESEKELTYTLRSKIDKHERTIEKKQGMITELRGRNSNLEQKLKSSQEQCSILETELRAQSLSIAETQVVKWFNAHNHLLPVEAGRSAPETFVERINFLMLPSRFEQFHTRLNRDIMNNQRAHSPSDIEVVYRYLCQTQKAFGATWTVYMPIVGETYNSGKEVSIGKPSGQIATVWVPGVKMKTKKGTTVLKPTVEVR